MPQGTVHETGGGVYRVALDEGQVVEEGTHEALLRARGLYARLWERQSGGFLPATDRQLRIA